MNSFKFFLIHPSDEKRLKVVILNAPDVMAARQTIEHDYLDWRISSYWPIYI